MYEVFLLIGSIFLLIIMITKLRIHAFLSLLIVSILLGIFAGMHLKDITTTIAAGFGGTMEYIGIVIVCGVIIGEVLEKTGGAQKIAHSILKIVGIKRAPTAAAFTGAVVSIPTFCDSGFVILNPVIKALSKVGKIPYMTLVMVLMGSLLITHSLVPPTPGPIAAAGILGADVGIVMVYGILVSIPIVIVTVLWANSKFVRSRYPELAPGEVASAKEDQEFYETVNKAPSTFMSYFPIVLPIILIVMGSFNNLYGNEETLLYQIISFLGTPYIALLLGALASFALPSKRTAEVMDGWVQSAIRNSAEIVLITGIAGGFGKMLQATGVSNFLAETISNTSLPSIVLPFIISSIVLIAQGSATVALTTTAGIIMPMLSTLGISPELAVIAIAGGSMCGVFPQGSYFWAVTKLAGFDLKKGYVAVTLTTFVMGITAFFSILILSIFVS